MREQQQLRYREFDQRRSAMSKVTGKPRPGALASAVATEAGR